RAPTSIGASQPFSYATSPRSLEHPTGLGAQDLDRTGVIDREIAARDILAGRGGSLSDVGVVHLDIGVPKIEIQRGRCLKTCAEREPGPVAVRQARGCVR